MEAIIGLAPWLAAILIAALGVSLTNILAWLKSDNAFDIRKSVASGLVAFIAGTVIVATTLQNLADGAAVGLAGLIIVLSLIATIAGIDVLSKNAVRAATK